jgi:hypothetical protein
VDGVSWLAGFYTVIDVLQQKDWAFPLDVIGMNSIAAYLIAHLFEGFILKNLKTHLGQSTFARLGTAYEPFLTGQPLVRDVADPLLDARRKLFLRI